MDKEKQLQLVKLMVESLKIPTKGEVKYPHGDGTFGTYKEYTNQTSESEFKRKCMQIRSEVKRLYE